MKPFTLRISSDLGWSKDRSMHITSLTTLFEAEEFIEDVLTELGHPGRALRLISEYIRCLKQQGLFGPEALGKEITACVGDDLIFILLTQEHIKAPMNNFDFLSQLSSATDNAARLRVAELVAESMAEKLGISATEAELKMYAKEHNLSEETSNGKAD